MMLVHLLYISEGTWRRWLVRKGCEPRETVIC
jgi:hypothetical protein